MTRQRLRYTRGMFSYPYPRPALTADVVAVRPGTEAIEVLLIRRGHDPFVGMWALPGGFVEEWESPEGAARREFAEETGAAWRGELRLVGVFGNRGRDPRGWTVACAYLAQMDEQDVELELAPADDASEAAWFPARALPPMAFDHQEIVAAALEIV